MTDTPPHCALGPQRCSQCAGFVPRKVDVQDGLVTVDGVPVRTVEPSHEPMRNYQRKGGRR